MRQLVEMLRETFASIAAFVGSTKEAYEGANRFAKYRIWILGLFGVDVVATLIFVLASGGRSLDLEVWYQQSFPSNMLIVRSEEDRPLRDVVLLLDGQYRLEVDVLPKGLKGFEVGRDFLNDQRLSPGEEYRPSTVEIRAGGRVLVLPIVQRAP